MTIESKIALFGYLIIAIIGGISDWFFANQFDPMLNTTKGRVLSAIRLGILWPLYLVKAILVEFL